MYYINNNDLKFYYKYLYRYINERNNMDLNDFYDKYISSELKQNYIPNVFEDITKQYLILKNKSREINPPFYKIGTYWYDNKVNKINGQFDVATLDDKGYIFYEVKYTKDPIDDNVIDEEIKQVSKLNLNYYNLGFVSKSGFNSSNNKYIFLTLDDIYNINK